MTDDTQNEHGNGAGKKSRLSAVVELPIERSISDKHLENLYASGLSDETIKLAELYTESRHAELAKLMARRVWPRMCGAALVFPFYFPGSQEPYGYRVRPTTPRVGGPPKRDGKKREVKYDQASELGVAIYFTPRARAGGWYADPSQVLYWTEGEKKALVFDQLGLCCVGLTGVWSYADQEHKDEAGERLHVRCRDHVAIAGRVHVICYDADSRTNDQVMLAAGRLAGVLLAAGAAEVRFIAPPTTEQKGIDDYYSAFGEVVTRQLLTSHAPIEPVSPKEPLAKLRLLKPLHDAPIATELRLPPDYSVERDGTLWKLGDEHHGDTRISRSVILLRRYLEDLYSDESRVEITFRRKERWHARTVDRAAVADRSCMITELARLGAPVTSNNAAGLVDWFDALEFTNEQRFEQATCVGRTGWHKVGGIKMFVLAEPVLPEGAELSDPVVIDDRGDRKKAFAALRQKGTLQEHIAALKAAWSESSIAAAAICAAFAAPLLEPLDAPNFALHLPGDSSRGKTSILKIAASVFGDPNNDQWVASWNTTATASEIRASILTSLPLCFDEVGASDVTLTEKLVYMLINGGGKARGQKDMHLRETLCWRTIVLSTGEHRLAGEDTATGAQVRVLQFHVSNFGQLDAAGVDELREKAADNCGHAGREWIETLLQLDNWEEVRRAHKVSVANFRQRAQNPLQQRQAGYFALLAFVEIQLCEIFGIGDPDAQTITRLFLREDASAEVESLAARARTRVLDWWHSQPDTFPELGKNAVGDETAKPDRGARVVNGYYHELDQRLLFIPGRLRAFLTEQRMGYPEVVRGWQELGWLYLPPAERQRGHGTATVKINGHSQRCVMFCLDAEGPVIA